MRVRVIKREERVKKPISTLSYLQKCVNTKKDLRKTAKKTFLKLQTIDSTEEVVFITSDNKCLDFKKYVAYCGLDGRKVRRIVEYVDISQPILNMEGLSYLLKQGYIDSFNEIIIGLLDEYAQKLIAAIKSEVEFGGKVSAKHIKGTTFFAEL